ncbi:MAG TPA: hypothetical protein PK854_00625 [Oscillospiraceae bacterium]|nr:hypothetical protein [Oscillospiraceae bacterium]HPS33757.1 hypothetical protein [Oscillospiraceae bacterium]
MKTRKYMALVATVLTITIILLAGCSSKKAFIGEWRYQESLAKITYIFKKDGTMSYIVSIASVGGGSNDNKNEGEYLIKDGKLIMSGLYLDIENKEYSYLLSEDGKTLILTRDGEDIVLTKAE